MFNTTLYNVNINLTAIPNLPDFHRPSTADAVTLLKYASITRTVAPLALPAHRFPLENSSPPCYHCLSYLFEMIYFYKNMDQYWTQCVEVLRTKLSDHVVRTWLEPVAWEECNGDRVTLSVPNNFFIVWIKDKYLTHLRDAVQQVIGQRCEIEFRSRNETYEEPPPEETKEDLHDEPVVAITAEFALKRNLNPRYTFESFVVGSCNQFARAAAQSVAENLGGNYNPLFLYGGVGLGKTHLMSAIGYELLSRSKAQRISFATSEEFTNEMINSIRYDKMAEFRHKYRNVDLLLIDDIQFIAGKERTQEEFFHTFNTLYESRKQIVITSDRFPNEIPEMENRLRSRFGWGLIADMGVPDLETRVAILKRKASEDSTELPDDVAYFLAEHVKSNVRELVGYLVRVIAMSTLQGIPLTQQLAQQALKDIIQRHVKTLTVDDIIHAVAKAFNVKPADIRSKKKHKLYSLPRQVGMYLARELTELSYPVIGQAFGGKDHSTVVYATKKIEKTLELNHSLRNTLDALKKDLQE
jgi:chromosomal replication initiator protein